MYFDGKIIDFCVVPILRMIKKNYNKIIQIRIIDKI